MPWEIIVYALLVGWVGGWWVWGPPYYAGPVDGHPDGGCPECGVVLGAIGGLAGVYVLGEAIGGGLAGVTVTAFAHGVVTASFYRMIVRFMRRGAVRADAARG